MNWGDNLLSPMDTAPPTIQSFASNDIDVCGCQAFRRKHLDIEGNLSYTETVEVQQKVEEIWKKQYSGICDIQLSYGKNMVDNYVSPHNIDRRFARMGLKHLNVQSC